MKTKGSTAWVFTTMVAVVLFMAACGNSQKKKEQAKVQATEQPADSVTVIESETVVIAVDSIAPDSAAMKQKAPVVKNWSISINSIIPIVCVLNTIASNLCRK